MNGRALLVAIGLLAAPLQAEEWAGTWQRIQVPGTCSSHGTESTCLLQLPERKLQDLVVDVPAEDQVVGFRLYAGSLGAWQLQASGFWHPAPESRHRIRTVNTFHGGPVRLELIGERRPPRLAGVTMDAGGPTTAPLPGPAPKASRAAFALEDIWFPAAWPVRADNARPGDMVHLELPDEVLGRLGLYEQWGLRVVTPEGQLPWTFEVEDLPRAQVEMAEARWVPAERPGWLRLSLPDLPEGPAYTEAQLFAPPQPLARRVLVEGEEYLWTCVPEAPLPCRLALGFYVNRDPPRRLPGIEIEGGADNPLPPLRVSVWRQTEYLAFVWPAQGPVRLLAGSDRAGGGSRVSLLSIDPRADDRPWKRAVLGPQEGAFLARHGHLGGAAFATLALVGLCLREWRQRKTLMAALLLFLCAAPGWSRDAFLEQTLEVPASGWVRVPLDLETLARLGPERRWLRVLGPDGTELPAGVWLETELPPDVDGRFPEDWSEARTFSSRPACEHAGGATRCLLRLPAPGLVPRELRVAVAGGEPGEKAGVRLTAVREGRREVLTDGSREASGDGMWRLPLETEPLTEVLGLELEGLRGQRRQVRVELDLVPASLIFEAFEPGAYRLVLGMGRGSEEWRRPYPFKSELSTLEPGPAQEHPLPPLPGETVAPRGVLGDLRSNAEWPVHAPGVAGEVIRLELPAEVYLRAGSTDRLRLETAGRQIPYVLRTLDVPAPVARGRIAARRDQISFDVPLSLPLIAWRLETRQPVSVWLVSGAWSSSPMSPSPNGQWVCAPGPLPSCVAEAEYVQKPSRFVRRPSLRIRGDASGEIDVTLVRQRHELIFVWPEEGGVRLLAGAEGTAAPTYDLRAVADQLPARSWRVARLGPVRERPATGPFRQVLLGAMALGLLAVVHRMMPRRSQPPAALH